MPAAGSVLIDTSVWIDYLRYKPHLPVVRQVNEIVLEEKAVIISPILYELLIGSRNEVVYVSIRERFSAITHVEMNEAIWEEASQLGFSLRRKGFTLPSIDVLIASAAIHYQLTLLHADKLFDIIARHSPLKILPKN